MFLLSMIQDYPENFTSNKTGRASKVIKQILTFPKQTQAQTAILTSQNFYTRGPFRTKFELWNGVLNAKKVILKIA